MARQGGESPGGEYERYRGAVLGMLAKRFPRLDEDERLGIYHDAWARVLVKRERGEEIDSLRAYLLATTAGEALHALSRGRPPAPIGPDDPRMAELADDEVPVEEQVVVRDQARIARNLLDSLDERQRDVLKLRWDLQLTGSEVRAALGLSRRQYQRLVEEGAAAVAERVRELQSGDWSRRQRSLLAACLVQVTGDDGARRVGIATFSQRERAQRLLESDPHVAAVFAEVRDALRHAAALLPLPVVAPEVAASPLQRLLEIASDVRDQLAGAFSGAKQQATAIYVRVSDPTLLASGPRPGATVAAVAGALAIGGGGAYLTQQTVTGPTPEPSSASAASSPVWPSTSATSETSRIARAVARTADAAKTQKPRKPPAPTPTRTTIQNHSTPQSQPKDPQPMPIPSPQSPPTQTPTEFGFED